MDYLETLDDMLAVGAARFSRSFAESHRRFLLSQQREDGGFAGRSGETSLYYTDFAVRALWLLSDDSSALSRAAEWLTRRKESPADVVEAFQRLNIARVLKKAGFAVAQDEAAIAQAISRQALPDGGFSRKGENAVSAYDTFLAVLSLRMLGPRAVRAVLPEQDGSAPILTCTKKISGRIPAATFPALADSVRRLRSKDGGFRSTPDAPVSQTNAAAAAISVLVVAEALTESERVGAARFFAAMQKNRSGFRAHAGARAADLLSTFSALVATMFIDRWDDIRLSDVARFLKSAARRDGGFGASAEDANADVEYTFYGLGATALLYACVENRPFIGAAPTREKQQKTAPPRADDDEAPNQENNS